MDFNPFTSSSNFVDLLSSQQQNVVFGSVSDSVSLSSSQPLFFGVQGTEDSNFGEDTQARWKERRTWSRIDDVVLISSWLNTSKDEVINTSTKSFFKLKFQTQFMASSSQNTLDESFDDAFEEIFDDFIDQTFEKFTIHGDQEERRKKRKNELISKEIVKKATSVYGMIISVKLQRILTIISDGILE